MTAVIEAREVSRQFAEKIALHRVTLDVGRGEICALLGPNGAGKTTLLRILAGLLEPTSGVVRVLGTEVPQAAAAFRRLIGLIPSGDRTFYLRLSGLENLVFFARLHGMIRRDAVRRAFTLLEQVGLSDSASLQVGKYSHGMQKRLSVARALLADPPILLADEATHDLDPQGARSVRELVHDAARRGAAVVWATQRIDEIRGFADSVTLITRGGVRFAGSVPQLMAVTVPKRYLLRIRNGQLNGEAFQRGLDQALRHMAAIRPAEGTTADHYVLTIADGVILGNALAALTAANFQVLACMEERPEIEEAFLRLTGEATSGSTV